MNFDNYTEKYTVMGKKTTICLLTLENGFEIVGSSACVDYKDFDFTLGRKYAKEKALETLGQYKGFYLQCNPNPLPSPLFTLENEGVIFEETSSLPLEEYLEKVTPILPPSLEEELKKLRKEQEKQSIELEYKRLLSSIPTRKEQLLEDIMVEIKLAPLTLEEKVYPNYSEDDNEVIEHLVKGYLESGDYTISLKEYVEKLENETEEMLNRFSIPYSPLPPYLIDSLEQPNVTKVINHALENGYLFQMIDKYACPEKGCYYLGDCDQCKND